MAGRFLRSAANRRPAKRGEIARAALSNHIADGPLRTERGKAIGVPGEPIHHKASVASACGCQPVLINPWDFNNLVQERHNVLIVAVAPIMLDRLLKTTAV